MNMKKPKKKKREKKRASSRRGEMALRVAIDRPYGPVDEGKKKTIAYLSSGRKKEPLLGFGG